jgi:uncharacterized protein YllA (UPF0747 family)
MKGFSWIAKGLEKNSGLLELKSASNGITKLGANSFAKALKVNSTLQNINLSRNLLKSGGTFRIIEALDRNNQFKF